MNGRALLFLLSFLLANASFSSASTNSSNATLIDPSSQAEQGEANATAAPYLRGQKTKWSNNDNLFYSAGKSIDENERELTLNILNLSYQQPLGAFLVLVHDSRARPLYTLGEAASEELALLAEYGRPEGLEDYYRNVNPAGVKSVTRFGSITRGGETSRFRVLVSDRYPMVTLAAKCENTNDCFVALNGPFIGVGGLYDIPGLDAGTEENNESCDSVPGPACAERRSAGLVQSGKGEGYVHVHRGVLGVGDLERGLDWKNPMIRITVTEDEDRALGTRIAEPEF